MGLLKLLPIIVILTSGCTRNIPSKDLLGLSKEEVSKKLGQPNAVAYFEYTAPLPNATPEEINDFNNNTTAEIWEYYTWMTGNRQLTFNINGTVMKVE